MAIDVKVRSDTIIETVVDGDDYAGCRSYNAQVFNPRVVLSGESLNEIFDSITFSYDSTYEGSTEKVGYTVYVSTWTRLRFEENVKNDSIKSEPQRITTGQRQDESRQFTKARPRAID